MNNFRARAQALDVINNTRSWMTQTTLGLDLRALDVMNNLGL